MPITLPTYQGHVSPTTRAPAVRVNPSAFSGPAEAMGEFGRQLTATATTVGVEMRRQQERNDAVSAAKQAITAETEWTQKLADAKQAAPDGAPDFTKTLLASFDTDADARRAAAPQSARGYMDLQLTRLRANLMEQGTAFESTARLGKQQRELGDVARLAANAVRSDDGTLPQHVGTFTGAVAASSLTEPMKIAVLRQGREMLAASAVQGMTERNPTLALAELGKGTYDADLSPAAKDRLLNAAQAEQHRRVQEAEQRKRQAEADHRARVADLRVEAAAAETALKLGVEYTGLEDLIAKADALDAKTAAGLRDAKADLGWQKGLLQLSPEAQRAEVDRVRADAKATENSAVAGTLAARAERGEALIAHAARALKADPLGYAESAGVSKPGDVLADLYAAGGDEAKVTAVLETRARTVAAVKERYGVPVPFLRPAEVDRLGAAFESGDAAQRTAALATLARIPTADVAPALQAWKADKPDIVAAVGISRADPRAAEAIVRGRAVRAEQPRAVPKAADPIFASRLDDYLGVYNARPDVRRQAEEAIRNVYADLSMRAGDLSGNVSGDRLEQAARTVIGNTVEWRGEAVVPPERTMTQEQFEDRMNALPDDVGAFTATGKPVSAATLRRYGTLEGVGQGQYRVRMNSGYALDAKGLPFVLDLRGAR